VHCINGSSRSAAIVAQHLMRSEHVSVMAALATIRNQRADVEPNHGFLKQLGAFEKQLNSAEPPHSAQTSASSTRDNSCTDASDSDASILSPPSTPRAPPASPPCVELSRWRQPSVSPFDACGPSKNQSPPRVKTPPSHCSVQRAIQLCSRDSPQHRSQQSWQQVTPLVSCI